MKLLCLICGSPMIQDKRPRKHCSVLCRQKAFRQKKLSQGYRLYQGNYYLCPDSVALGVLYGISVQGAFYDDGSTMGFSS